MGDSMFEGYAKSRDQKNTSFINEGDGKGYSAFGQKEDAEKMDYTFVGVKKNGFQGSAEKGALTRSQKARLQIKDNGRSETYDSQKKLSVRRSKVNATVTDRHGGWTQRKQDQGNTRIEQAESGQVNDENTGENSRYDSRASNDKSHGYSSYRDSKGTWSESQDTSHTKESSESFSTNQDTNFGGDNGGRGGNEPHANYAPYARNAFVGSSWMNRKRAATRFRRAIQRLPES